jgi:hypothetical protein
VAQQRRSFPRSDNHFLDDLISEGMVALLEAMNGDLPDNLLNFITTRVRRRGFRLWHGHDLHYEPLSGKGLARIR